MKLGQKIGVSALTLCTLFLVAAIIYPIATNSQSKYPKQERSMEFKFENYPTSEEAKKEIEKFSPIGSDIVAFVKAMKPVVGSSSCYGSAPDETRRYVVCTYSEQAVKSDFARWVVIADYSPEQKITGLDVVRSTKPTDLNAILNRGEIKLAAKSDVSFRFEDQQAPAEAKAKLSSLFPKGSKMENFMALMRRLGAECYGAVPGGSETSVCRYKEQGFSSSVFRVWTVSFKVDSADRLELLDVNTGLVGT